MCTHISIWHLLCQIMPGPCRGGSFGKMKLAIRHQRLIGRLLRCRSNEVLKTRNHAKLPEWGVWTNESLNQWTHEPVNYQWMKNQWTIQSVNQWTNEAMNRWINDSVNLWINDSGNQRINQSKQRNNEPMNQGSETTNRWNNQWSDELHESLNQWISEPFNHWTNESMKAWLSDCMNQWIKEWTNEGMDGWVNYFFVDLLLHWGTSSLSYFFSDQLLIWVTSSLARFCYELPSSVASATQFFFSFFCNLQWQFRLAHTWPDAGRTTFHAAAPTMSCNPTEQESGNIADAFPCHAANEPRHSRLQTRI